MHASSSLQHDRRRQEGEGVSPYARSSAELGWSISLHSPITPRGSLLTPFIIHPTPPSLHTPPPSAPPHPPTPHKSHASIPAYAHALERFDGLAVCLLVTPRHDDGQAGQLASCLARQQQRTESDHEWRGDWQGERGRTGVREWVMLMSCLNGRRKALSSTARYANSCILLKTYTASQSHTSLQPKQKRQHPNTTTTNTQVNPLTFGPKPPAKRAHAPLPCATRHG